MSSKVLLQKLKVRAFRARRVQEDLMEVKVLTGQKALLVQLAREAPTELQDHRETVVHRVQQALLDLRAPKDS
jgi:sRNA-binding carbon storage regulator CsrA